MENELSFTNFYKHPRFWRHATAWLVFFFFIGVTILATVINNPIEEMVERPIGEEITDAVAKAIAGVVTKEKPRPSGTTYTKEIGHLLFIICEILFLIYGSFYAYNKLFKRKKYVQLFVVILCLITFTSFIDTYLNTTVVQIGELKGFWADMVTFPFLLMVAFGFKLAYHGGRQLFVIQRLENKQTESELKLLKSQVNPHFLFNTLNNIYSTNLENQEKANDIILELADLLRYQLESGKKTKTSLQQEINSLENYIALEKIRVLDCTIQVEKEGDFESVQIVPLLLLPFVENAFKYGTGIEPGDITIRFHLDDKGLFSFFCSNKIVQKRGKVHSGGIGLQNVKKRLALKYKNNYDLALGEKDDYFEVVLKVRLR